MKASFFLQAGAATVLAALLAGCNRRAGATSAPDVSPAAEVEREEPGLILVERPERFPIVTATRHVTAADLNVTGVVSADVTRNVPVVSIASGRILEIYTRLGDAVKKGQILMKVQSIDIADAFADYKSAVADEKLANAQLARSKLLFEKGAIARKELEVVQQEEEKADVAVETAIERLQVLGANKDHPTPIVEITAPASGIVTEQQVTTASGTQGLASPSAFVISDLSRVWILCDVYENDLPLVRVGESAEIRLNAYPNMVLKGRVGNIGSILDPAIRTAKVRVEIDNPGQLRLGMFVRATFHGQQQELRSAIPASAILHLHDRDWVYVPAGPRSFRRVEVQSGRMLPPDRQEILSGLRPGDRVIANPLLLQTGSER
ncbi:MAG TPA: efflux RND transporter periplasmic adaptor subunit [Candidatus Acidoferrum sp.]|nr:efflux RND transporter periplasmic adaptor subunit [Candidatus Acidoferrum sp.]